MIYLYASEGFCRACFNYWRFCDCISTFHIDEGHPIEKKDDSDRRPDDVVPSVVSSDIVPYVPSSVFQPGLPRLPPSPRRPMPPRTPSRPTPDRPLAKRPKGDQYIPDPAPSSHVFDPTADYAPSLVFPDNFSIDYDAPQRDDQMDSVDPSVFLDSLGTDIDTMISSQSVPTALTPEEANDVMNDILLGNPFTIPAGVEYPLPSLDQLGPIPYSRSSTNAATLLNYDDDVPKYFGEYVHPNGTRTAEYIDWYHEIFCPWYRNNATDTQKFYLTGVVCLEPPRGPGTREWPGVDGIYVHERTEGHGGGTANNSRYTWSIDGETYEKWGYPSVLEVFYPKLFLPLNSRRAGQPRSGVRDRSYVFPDAFVDDNDDDNVAFVVDNVLSKVDTVKSINYVNTTIESGNGDADNIYYPPIVEDPNCWKTMTYQWNGRYASAAPLLFTRGAFPFYGSTTSFLMSPNGAPYSHDIYVYNHMLFTNINKACHGVSTLNLTATDSNGIDATAPVNWGVRARARNGTVLRMFNNFVGDVANLNFVPTDSNGFYSVSSVNLAIGVHISPAENVLFSGTPGNDPAIIWTIRCWTGPTSGSFYRINHHRAFQNRLSRTPGFNQAESVSSTDIVYLGNNFRIATAFNSEILDQLLPTSDPLGTNTYNFFSKALAYANGNYRVRNGSTGAFTNLNAGFPWVFFPCIPLDSGTSTTVLNVQGEPIGPAPNRLNGYRTQHVNISNTWL